MSRIHNITIRNIHGRRQTLERKLQIQILPPEPTRHPSILQNQDHLLRVPLEVKNGIVIVAGDAHYWPTTQPFMHHALKKMLNKFREEKLLRALICNGDMHDFAQQSRFPVIDWEKQPTPKQELEFGQDCMSELATAAGRVPRLWPRGNHDARYNLFLAKHAKELEGIPGMNLKDHFPDWQFCLSVMINNNTFVKHRLIGSTYAVRHNILKAGVHVITNHNHSAKVWMETNLRGTLYGVDCGMLAEINTAQFRYLEDAPVDWREAFAVLKYENGELMHPELVLRHPTRLDCITFRGETIKVT